MTTTRTSAWLCVVGLLVVCVSAARAQEKYAGLPPGGISHKDASSQARKLTAITKTYEGGEMTSYNGDVGIRKLYNLTHEEGIAPGEDPNTKRRPMRSGYEATFYRKFKTWIAKNPGKRMGREEMLEMGVESCANTKGDVNMPDVFLTLHNMTRILSRPQQWTIPTSREWMKTDPVYPILQDILGIEPIEGKGKGKTLAEMLDQKRTGEAHRGWAPGEVIDRDYTQHVLFDTENGIFETLEGARGPFGNGGAWYYFWLGTYTSSITTTWMTGHSLPALFAMHREMDTKIAEGEDSRLRGAMQLSHFSAGTMFGSRCVQAVAWRNLRGGLLGARAGWKARYCTNNPTIRSAVPLPQEVKRGNLPKASAEEYERVLKRILKRRQAEGVDPAPLETFQAALLDRLQQLKGPGDLPAFIDAGGLPVPDPTDPASLKAWREKALGAGMAWWLRTVAARDLPTMSSGLSRNLDALGKFDPKLRQAADGVLESIRKAGATAKK